MTVRGSLRDENMRVVPPFDVSSRGLFRYASPICVKPRTALCLQTPLGVKGNAVVKPHLAIRATGRYCRKRTLPCSRCCITTRIIVRRGI